MCASQGLWLIGAGQARASDATLYVDQADPACSDGGSGTQSQPFCTIGAAARVAVTDRTVLIASGIDPRGVGDRARDAHHLVAESDGHLHHRLTGSSTRDFNAHVSSLGPSASFYADEVWITASWPWRDAHRVAYLTYGP
jgi:hypothetical protein